jgi:hypothetical protein
MVEVCCKGSKRAALGMGWVQSVVVDVVCEMELFCDARQLKARVQRERSYQKQKVGLGKAQGRYSTTLSFKNEFIIEHLLLEAYISQSSLCAPKLNTIVGNSGRITWRIRSKPSNT